MHDDRGDPPAPDRPGDLHPLQHLRGDLPGRRGHARRAQLRRRRREVQQLQRLHRALPDRRDRQLAPGREGRSLTRSEQQLVLGQPAAAAGDRRRRRAPSCRPTSCGSRRWPRRARAAPCVPPWSAAHPYVNLYTIDEAGDRDRQRQFPPDRRRRVAATSGTSCSISAARRFRCSKARRSASSRPASTRTAGRTTCASTRSRARAKASGRATTTSRSP